MTQTDKELTEIATETGKEVNGISNKSLVFIGVTTGLITLGIYIVGYHIKIKYCYVYFLQLF